MRSSIKESLENMVSYVFYNEDGNQGPYKFQPISFNKVDSCDYNVDSIVDDIYKKDNWAFWLLKIDITPLVSNSFSTTSKISNDISISDESGNSYAAVYGEPSFDEPGICEVFSLHKYDFSVKIPNCKYQASLLFYLPNDAGEFNINYNDTPKRWYKPKIEHNNEIPLLDVIDSSNWYSCKFQDSPDLNIRIQFVRFEALPLSNVIEAIKGSNRFHCGYYNLEYTEFKILSIRVVNLSKRENNEVGGYLLGRLILLQDMSLYYAAQGLAGHYVSDFTSRLFGTNDLLQSLTPKIVYNVKIVYLVAKNIPSLSLGLRYGTLVEI